MIDNRPSTVIEKSRKHIVFNDQNNPMNKSSLGIESQPSQTSKSKNQLDVDGVFTH